MSKRALDDDDGGGDESKQEANKKARVEDHADAEKPHCPICFLEWEADENPSAAVESCAAHAELLSLRVHQVHGWHSQANG